MPGGPKPTMREPPSYNMALQQKLVRQNSLGKGGEVPDFELLSSKLNSASTPMLKALCDESTVLRR